MIALPKYIDTEAWAGFEEMRKLIKKPMTDRARKQVVYELDRIRKAGHCPNAALIQSEVHCWADVYEPQQKEIKQAATSEADKTARFLAEERARDAQLAATKAGRQPIRRVA
jgi:hypothetical protein